MEKKKLCVYVVMCVCVRVCFVGGWMKGKNLQTLKGSGYGYDMNSGKVTGDIQPQESGALSEGQKYSLRGYSRDQYPRSRQMAGNLGKVKRKVTVAYIPSERAGVRWH